MEKPNIQSQGMLKMLQDLFQLLKSERREASYKIFNRVGLEQKYWFKLVNADIITNLSKAPSRPIYKWNAIEPNLYMALETLKDYPQYNIDQANKDMVKNYYKATQICWHCGKIFPKKRKTAKYCSDLCRKQYNRKRNGEPEMFPIPPPKQENIIPPKLEWVRVYCAERKNNIDPEKFIEWYNKTGWKQKDGSPISNWKRAIITWEINRKRPIQINQVANISDMSDNDLIAELKKRGYSGDVNKKIEF